MTTENIFEKLKRKKLVTKKDKFLPKIFFQICFDDSEKAFLKVIDADKKEDADVSYRYYNGKTREVLKFIESISDKNLYSINWQDGENRIYLSDNEFLIEQLRGCQNVVDQKFNNITFDEGVSEVVFSMEGDKHIISKAFLQSESKMIDSRNFLLISEGYVFSESCIYKIPPLGTSFSELKLFETKISSKDAEKYLSLIYSYFDNISVIFRNYHQVKGNISHTQPSIIFERIDEENSLHVRITETIHGFTPDFIDSYNVSKIAVINNLENTIVISDIENRDLSENFNEISKLLNKYKKSLSENNNYFVNDNLFIIEEELARDFIHKELSNLITKFAVFGSEELKSYNIKTVTPKLSLSGNFGINYFEGDANLDIDGELISVFDAINFYRKNSYIPLSDGTNAIINKSYIDKLVRILKKNKNKVKISFFDLPLVEELIDEKIYQESFKECREIFLGFNNLNEMEVKIPKIKTELRNYQKQGYKWLKYLHKHSLGGCLADDMGLGKTVQTISLLSSVYPSEKLSSLIVMPKSLVFNWENEIKKFNPKITYYIYYGNDRKLDDAKKKNIIITTYAMIRNDIEKFKEEKFNYIILDESQNIKNVHSQISKAVMLLESKHRLALSGTPIENNLGELYSLFRFLNPTMFGSIEDFNENYSIPIQKENNRDVVNELKMKVYPFILRRLKKEVLKDLPDKIEQTLFIEMSREHKEFYEQRRIFYQRSLKDQIEANGIKKSQLYILQAMSELRQIASIPEVKSDEGIISPKREVLMENIFDVIANGHRVLVFANFLSVIEYVSQDLEKHGVEHLIMTGATRDRKELVEKFQKNNKYKVFIMTLKTGGLGLNLTAADYVFIFDPWWNKSVENQAIDRTHRIGQDKTVFSYKLITKDTIEEKILELQRRKTELFESIISSDDSSIKSLDEQDIDFILGD